MQQTIVGRAAGGNIDWCNSQQQPAAKIPGDSTNARGCMTQKQFAAKHHVVPDCEISAGTPIAGQRTNTAVDIIIFQV